MLSTKVPASLHFLINAQKEIFGVIVINHGSTYRGHLHAGIVPWHRGKGYGTIMLRLALERCLEMGIDRVQIVYRKENTAAIETILRNGGVLLEEFCEDRQYSLRFEIKIAADAE